MTIHGAGFSARSGAGNNEKTTVAGKGYFFGDVPSLCWGDLPPVLVPLPS